MLLNADPKSCAGLLGHHLNRLLTLGDKACVERHLRAYLPFPPSPSPERASGSPAAGEEGDGGARRPVGDPLHRCGMALGGHGRVAHRGDDSMDPALPWVDPAS